MSEFFLELFSEEIPSSLQKNLREDLLDKFNNLFKKKYKLNVKLINASKMYYKKLDNTKDPEKKRKIIGNLFIKIFEKESKKLKGVKYLAQGTLYPDVIEKVKKEGDLGLKELVQKFDKIKLNKIEELYISKNILKEAYLNLKKEEKIALDLSAKRIKEFHITRHKSAHTDDASVFNHQSGAS